MNIEIAMQIVDCNIRRNEGDKDIEKIDPNRVLEATKIVLSKIKELSLFSVTCSCCGKNRPEICGSCVSDIAQETGSAALESR